MRDLMQAYANFVKSRAKEFPNGYENLLHASVGCSTEAGQFLDTMKKVWVYGQALSHTNKEGQSHFQNIDEELGDMLFYIQLACIYVGTDIESLVRANMTKLAKRYPTGYSDAAAATRADNDDPIPVS